MLGRLARGLLLFLEFDFKVIYKPGKIHGVADALSRNEGAKLATGIPDQTTDAHLFSIQPDWTHPIIDYLQTGTFPPSMTKEARKRLAYRACRSMKTQVNPNSALNRTKHHQSNPSNVPGILGSNLSKRACIYTSKSFFTLSNRIRSPTGFLSSGLLLYWFT